MKKISKGQLIIFKIRINKKATNDTTMMHTSISNLTCDTQSTLLLLKMTLQVKILFLGKLWC